ncbi:PAS domain-containing hybrid sensor histidine kinase/response regulator [Thiovibrio sp. JS02]
MSPTESPSQGFSPENYQAPWWAYGLMAGLIVFLFFSINYAFQLGLRMTGHYAPLVDAAMEIRLEATTAHLWFEEVISGDRHESFESVLGHLDAADRHAEAMLEDESGPGGPLLAMDDAQLRENIKTIRDRIARFREATTERWKAMETSGIGTEIDQRYDALFAEFINQADLVEASLQQSIKGDLSRFRSTRTILLSACLALFFLSGMVFYRLEKRRAASFIALRKAHQTIRNSERWLKTTMRSLGDGLIVTDTRGKVTYLNPIAEHLTGWPQEEAQGEDIEKVFHIINETTRQPAEHPVRQVIKKKYIVGLANHTLLLSRDGHEYPIADSGAPIIDDQGNMMGIVMVFHDISARRQVEKELLKSKEQWEKSFNAIEDILTIQDMDMRIIRANKAAARLLGIPAGELVGRYCHEVFAGTSEPCPGCPELETLADLRNHSQTITHEKLGRTFQVSTAAVLDKDGRPEYLVHFAKDISEKLKLEEDLFQARKMEAIGTLAGGIAHDFNNILSAMIGYAELARMDIENDKNQAAADLDAVLNGAHRAAELVKQILTFSRKGGESLEPLAPYLIVKESLKLLRASLPSTIQIKEDIDPESGKILADPTRVQQVLVNLCTNALHAMENEQGVLSVKLSRRELGPADLKGEPALAPGPYVELMVADTGRGMAPATMQRIFEPYFTTKEPGRGTGMGLALVHGIVKNFGGMIKVDSTVGAGTLFRVYFPALETATPGPEQDKTPEQLLPGGNEHILVVDDENMLAGMQKSMLEHLGYRVTATTSSLNALDLFQKAPAEYDLLVTDQTMPDLTGAELAKAVLRIRPEMPVILCTGYSSMISEEQAKELGIRAFLLKPIDRVLWTKTVRRLLDETAH